MATEVYKKIQSRAAALGISIQELQRKVGISAQTLPAWQRKTPKTIEIYDKIDNFLTEQEQEKTE
jgi:hypothetical protein